MAAKTIWYDATEQIWKAMTIAAMAGIPALSDTGNNPGLGVGTKCACFEDGGYYEYDGETFKRFG